MKLNTSLIEEKKYKNALSEKCLIKSRSNLHYVLVSQHEEDKFWLERSELSASHMELGEMTQSLRFFQLAKALRFESVDEFADVLVRNRCPTFSITFPTCFVYFIENNIFIPTERVCFL